MIQSEYCYLKDAVAKHSCLMGPLIFTKEFWDKNNFIFRLFVIARKKENFYRRVHHYTTSGTLVATRIKNNNTGRNEILIYNHDTNNLK